MNDVQVKTDCHHYAYDEKIERDPTLPSDAVKKVRESSSLAYPEVVSNVIEGRPKKSGSAQANGQLSSAAQ